MEATSAKNDSTLTSDCEMERQADNEVSSKDQTEDENIKEMAPEPEPSKHLELGQQTDNNSVSSQMKVENETVVKDTKDESTVSNREEVPLEDENIKEKEVVIGNENSKASVTEAENVKRQDIETMNGEVQKEDEKSSTASGGDSDKSEVIVESKSVQMPNIDPMLNKKIKKKDKSSKEEEKLVELLVHVFDGLETPEKKMEALAKKYIQLAADMKTTEGKLEDTEGKHKEAKREKEQLQNDFIKVNMAKTKLESLCRELQKQNKVIKEEIQKRSDEEDRKRRELSQKFQSTINDITTQMGENHKRNQQLKQDNTDLAQKLKGLVEQYEVREQHIEKVLKAKQLELQLCEAKLQQQTNILQEERQNHLKEKHALLSESLEQEKKKVEMLVKQEAELKGQLSLYTEKFVEFQSTLTKSNEVFATFKKEMDKMTKTIRKLEKESNTWKTRYENTNVSLVQMVEERTQKDNEISVQKGKVDKLEKLCRALQAERRKLKKELEQHDKANNTNDASSEDSGKATASKSCQDMALKNGEDDPCIEPGSNADSTGSLGPQVDEKSVDTANDKSILDDSENSQNVSKSDAVVNESGDQIN